MIIILIKVCVYSCMYGMWGVLNLRIDSADYDKAEESTTERHTKNDALQGDENRNKNRQKEKVRT